MRQKSPSRGCTLKKQDKTRQGRNSCKRERGKCVGYIVERPAPSCFFGFAVCLYTPGCTAVGLSCWGVNRTRRNKGGWASERARGSAWGRLCTCCFAFGVACSLCLIASCFFLFFGSQGETKYRVADWLCATMRVFVGANQVLFHHHRLVSSSSLIYPAEQPRKASSALLQVSNHAHPHSPSPPHKKMDSGMHAL